MWPDDDDLSGSINVVSDKVFGVGVLELADGESEVIDARAMAKMTVVAGSGATATISRVDSPDATADGPGFGDPADVAAESLSTIDVDWPFYRITSTGGPTRVGLV